MDTLILVNVTINALLKHFKVNNVFINETDRSSNYPNNNIEEISNNNYNMFNPNQFTEFLNEFKQMFKQLTEQNNTILNILSQVIHKLLSK